MIKKLGNFLMQISPQKQLQEATTAPEQPAEQDNKNPMLEVNSLAIGANINNLNAVLNQFVAKESKSFKAFAGKLLRRDETEEKIANGKRDIDNFSQYILKDLTGSLSGLYADGASPTQQEIQNALNQKIAYLKTPSGFQNYLVELANSEHLTAEEKAQIKQSVFDGKEPNLQNIKPDISKTISDIYKSKGLEISSIADGFFTNFAYDNENLETKKTQVTSAFQASAESLAKAREESENKGGFLEIIFEILKNFLGEEFTNSISGLFGGNKTQTPPAQPQQPEAPAPQPAPLAMVTNPTTSADIYQNILAGQNLDLTAVNFASDYTSNMAYGVVNSPAKSQTK
ncbi:MAG: hypothetical protein SFT90_05660 [Rickettsiales bacterium]|nr:hypothetical protein [Rickettsiales bacterium]